MKCCTKCNIFKLKNQFHKDKSKKDGLDFRCKECVSQQKKEYKLLYPEILIWHDINQRCNNPNNDTYQYYGGRGIKNEFKNPEEIKFLYLRDKAYLMKCSSIDRIDNNGNYCLDNCEFIERNKNSKKRNEYYRKPIIQYDLQMNKINEWESILKASITLKIPSSSIFSVLNKTKLRKTHNFIFKYKE